VPETLTKAMLPLGLVVGCVVALYYLVAEPGSNHGYTYLAAVIFLEILLAVLWDYRQRFFPLVMGVFLLAGLNLPLQDTWTSARWFVLGLGAVVGLTFYLKNRVHTFGLFHLLALFCAVAALVSALASSYPRVAFLKALSLLMMFLYAAAGARIAVVGREAKFLAELVLGCEILAYVSAISYFILRYPLYGNPNSLGVVMGIVVTPVLLWGVLVSEGTGSQRRRIFALILSLLLLLSSYARASIGAALISSILVLVSLRRYRLLTIGAGMAVLGAVLVAVVFPLHDLEPNKNGETLTDIFLYKGERDQGIFGSRESPWDKTSSVIREHPWFGSGFGTSVTDYEIRPQDLSFRSVRGATREHGNSYLAIAEWTGLLGVVPFYALILVVAINVSRVLLWMRRTGSALSPAVPIAAVLAAGVVHATFEDWMFAVGYYMCVFFWALAFVLVDILPSAEPAAAPIASPAPSPGSWDQAYGVIPSGR
jgi:O-antigen ligase